MCIEIIAGAWSLRSEIVRLWWLKRPERGLCHAHDRHIVIQWQTAMLPQCYRMSLLTLSRSIPTAIFTILASYALWESHSPYKKRLRLRQTVSFIFIWYRSPWHLLIIITNQLPDNHCTWRVPGETYEEQIWINLDKVFRDAGIMLWSNAYHCVLRIPDHASSSGFGYVIPTRIKGAVGSLSMLREFNYLVCSLVFYSTLNQHLLRDRMHACELHVPEMDLMSSSALSSLERMGMTIWKFSGQLRWREQPVEH